MALAIPNTSPAVQKIQELAQTGLSKYDAVTIANDKQAMSNVLARDYHEFCDTDKFFNVSSQGVNKIIQTICDNNNLNSKWQQQLLLCKEAQIYEKYVQEINVLTDSQDSVICGLFASYKRSENNYDIASAVFTANFRITHPGGVSLAQMSRYWKVKGIENMQLILK